MTLTDGVICDKCHQPITDNEKKEGATLHYGKTDYHCGCYVDYLRDKGVIFKKGVVLSGNVVAERKVS